MIDEQNPNRFVCTYCESDEVYDPPYGRYFSEWLDCFGRFLDTHARCKELLTVEGA